MIFPLEQLIEFSSNMYEATCASMRRSFQLNIIKDPEVENNDGKVVSYAARQVFTKQVTYRLESK